MTAKSRNFQISVIRDVLALEKKAAGHIGISGARNNISATQELRGGEFVKGRKGRRVSNSVCKLGFGSI